jgi:alkyl hydroperoxide reductase subunit F
MSFKLNLDFGSAIAKTSQNNLDPGTTYDVLVVGGGPAGLNAALYASRKGLVTGILTKRKGGQILDTSEVDNYLGIKSMSGEGLVQEFLSHVDHNGIPVLSDVEVTGISSGDGVHSLMLDTGETYRARSIIVATGSKPRTLGVPGEQEYSGKGVSYCAICDGPFFKGREVFVAGGGNSAAEAAIDIAKVASKVTIVHRSQFRSDKVLTDQLYSNPKISVMLGTTITEVIGDGTFKGLKARDNATGEEKLLQGDGLFVEIGHDPFTGPFGKLVDLNSHGEIIVNLKNETGIPGIYAAGDVTEVPYKQIVIAASDGAKAALSASEYLNRLKA